MVRRTVLRDSLSGVWTEPTMTTPLQTAIRRAGRTPAAIAARIENIVYTTDGSVRMSLLLGQLCAELRGGVELRVFRQGQASENAE